jgi:glutathione S-transferase
MTLVLHAIPDFASLIPRLVMADAGIDHRMVLQSDDRALRDTPAFRAVSPFALIPALETPEGPVFETGAILLWLADRHAGLAPAAGDPDRGRFLSWLMWTANTLHPLVMDLIHPYRQAGDGAEGAVAASARARIKALLPMLDTLVATAPDWASPDRPGVLLPYLAVLLRWARAFPYDPAQAVGLEGAPRLAAAIARFEHRPAVQGVAAAEGIGTTPFTAP